MLNDSWNPVESVDQFSDKTNQLYPMQFAKAILQYYDLKVELPANKMTFFDELYVDFKEVDKGQFRTYHLAIHPKQPIQM